VTKKVKKGQPDGCPKRSTEHVHMKCPRCGGRLTALTKVVDPVIFPLHRFVYPAAIAGGSGKVKKIISRINPTRNLTTLASFSKAKQ